MKQNYYYLNTKNKNYFYRIPIIFTDIKLLDLVCY